MFKRTLIAAAAFAVTACATAPAIAPSSAQKAKATVNVQPAASGPAATPQHNVTHFAGGLRCMDDLLYRFGVRDVSVMIEEMQDNSHRLGAGTRDMMVSAYAEMTRRSRGVRLVTFGQDNQNVVLLLTMAQRINDFKVVPQYDIRGSITQFDEDIDRTQAGLGASFASPFGIPLFGVRFNRNKQTSVLAFDASVITTRDLSLVPGANSKNTVVITREDNGMGDSQAQINSGTLSFNFDVARNEGIAQSLRNMIELSAIELTGKLVRLPYWTCLGIDTENAEVKREMEDWFLSMQGSTELTSFFQEQLRFRKFYDGPIDGKSNVATTEALKAYRAALNLPADGELDMTLFSAFLLRPVPKPPEKPFVAAKPAGSQGESDTGTATPKEINLSVNLAKTRYRAGETIDMTVSIDQPGYVYCFIQSPTNGKIQRIFPNRFARDPRLEAGKPLVLPGAQGFKIAAGAEGVKQQAVGCFATEREVYNELPAQLRWGDFEDIRLATFDDIRDGFVKVAKGPVALTGTVIDVTDK